MHIYFIKKIRKNAAINKLGTASFKSAFYYKSSVQAKS